MPITRKAILISSPTAYESKDLSPGTDNDMEKWRSFLESPKGGCWNSQDIIDYSFASSEPLCSFISGMETQDYVFVVYSGHGFQNSSETYIFESQTSYVNVKDVETSLATISSKATLIVDACRSILQSTPSYFDYSFLKCLINESYSGNEQVAWETALTNCKTTGVVTIYSCKLDETSSMQPDNKSSLFSDQLLASPNKGFGKILTLGKAFDYADRITNSTAYLKGKKQNPQIELNGKKIGCFSVDYPFAVK